MESDNPSWICVLRNIASKLNDERIAYTIVGGASIILQGVSIPLKDIDVETNSSGAFRFQKLYQEYTMETVSLVESEIYRSYYGRYIINDILVEVMGDIQRREESKWIATSCSTQTIIKSNGIPIACSWIEEETLAYIRRGRLNRAALCLKHCNHTRLMSLIKGEVRTNVI